MNIAEQDLIFVGEMPVTNKMTLQGLITNNAKNKICIRKTSSTIICFCIFCLFLANKVEFTLESIDTEYIMPILEEYVFKASFIAKAMKHEYDFYGLEKKHVNEILPDENLLRRFSFSPYLINMILSIYRMKAADNKTFISILAPSCTGKTQLAFVLDFFSKYPFCQDLAKHRSFENRETLFHSVLHFVCNSSPKQQDIYKSLVYSLEFFTFLNMIWKKLLGKMRIKER